MRTLLIVAAALLTASTAYAQKPANPDANTPAVTTPSAPRNPNAPVEGANSFTEGQAKARIENEGYTNVSGLAKDDKGVWRGTALRGGKQVSVSLDFQGNVTSN
jgi:hypothetical protein